MPDVDPIRYNAATAVVHLAARTFDSAVHRTRNRAPTGEGWVQCVNSPDGVLCRPDKVREAIAYLEIAYEVWPDIACLNQIALGYEMLGETTSAHEHFAQLHAQALAESDATYRAAALRGIERNR
ncbi:MAG: hypothetical protein QNJ91_12320 [Gammaproteobacteria bacterium]|nr:hypothetical protein [Gammaproteobacteria bacterium]